MAAESLAQGDWTTFTTVDGLPDNYISSIAIAAEGTVWAGTTYKRVSRFDGERWETYTAPGDTAFTINSLVIAPNGNVWMAGTQTYSIDGKYINYYSGVCRFDGKDWIIYTVSQGLPSNDVRSLSIGRNGEIWATTGKGVACFKNDTWSSVHDNGNPVIARPMTIAPDGTVWFGSQDTPHNDDRIFRYKDSSWSNFLLDEIDGDIKKGYTLQTMITDSGGVLWFGTYESLFTFDGAKMKDMEALPIMAIPGDRTRPYISSLALGPDNSIWCGINYNDWDGYDVGGLYQYNGSAWKRYSNKNGLVSKMVFALAVAPDGTVWAGTYKGLSRFNPTRTTVKENAGPKEFSILGNHPNPFNPNTTISFTLPESGQTNLSIYSITGQKIRTLVSGRMSAGEHSVVWNGLDDFGMPAASGIYLSRLEGGGKAIIRKMLLVR